MAQDRREPEATGSPRGRRRVTVRPPNRFLPDEDEADDGRPALEAADEELVVPLSPEPPEEEEFPQPPSRSRPRAEWYGPYLLLRKVAQGGMAEVFMAKQGGIGGFEKVLAIKRLLPHLARDQALVDMFIHEAKVVAVLAHPSIVQTFALGKLGASYYIAMEYVDGRDLRTIQRRAAERGLRLPIDLAVFVAARIAGALAYAHRRADERGRPLRIVHRDVSPQNILISYDGIVKLTDFGIARAVTRATVNVRGLLRGKLSYMSPEQARGTPGPRSDLFSLGAVLYELLTGERPLRGDSERSLLLSLSAPRIAPLHELNPRLPARLAEVVMKAVSPDPDDRFADGLAFQRALEHSLGEHPQASSKELARFMDVLFDRSERGVPPVEEPPVEAGSPVEFENELETPSEGPEPPPPADDLSVVDLLRRFRRR